MQVRGLILQYATAKLSTIKIQRVLENRHGVKTTRHAIRRFLDRYKETGSVSNKMRKRKPSILNSFHERMIDFWLSNNSELTSKMLSDKLRDLFGITVSTSL